MFLSQKNYRHLHTLQNVFIFLKFYIHYRYAKTVNDIFNQALFLQLFGGILLLCTSVYYLSTHFMEKEFITVLVYAICMFVQIYVYCWSGNEVMLKVNVIKFYNLFRQIYILSYYTFKIQIFQNCKYFQKLIFFSSNNFLFVTKTFSYIRNSRYNTIYVHV